MGAQAGDFLVGHGTSAMNKSSGENGKGLVRLGFWTGLITPALAYVKSNRGKGGCRWAVRHWIPAGPVEAHVMAADRLHADHCCTSEQAFLDLAARALLPAFIAVAASQMNLHLYWQSSLTTRPALLGDERQL
jgi:hypothetical protein